MAPRHTSEAMELRPVSAGEEPAFTRACQAAFHDDPQVDDRALTTALFEPARSLAVLDDAAIVATTSAYTRELSVPGAVVDAACVTDVGVLPTHRRRGLLTRLMRRQLDDVHERGEPIAALWASEPGIYGRFGYGLAARAADVSIATTGARVRHDAPSAPGRLVLLAPSEAIPRAAPLYDALRRGRVGHLSRGESWWTRRVHDPPHRRAGARPLRAVVREDADGRADGYALYAVRDEGAGSGPPGGTVVVRELFARSPGATSALWAYLAGLDLTWRVTWEAAPPDEPPDWFVSLPERPRVRLTENLWVRVVDAGTALARRTYAAPVEVVLDVDDGFCPWNSGRWRLAADATGATCERTGAPADLALSAIDLGAAYLGGPTLAALAAAGRVRELRAGALAATSLAFTGTRAPWCPEVF